MTTYIIRRLLLMFPTLLGVTAVVFFVMALAPGGFGGDMLTEHGSLTEGEEARRIRQYFLRRYGGDQPAYIQFGRWLNQVSPIGFVTSAKITFDDGPRNQARQILQDAPFDWPKGVLDQAVQAAAGLAAYQDTQPADVAPAVQDAVQDPVQGLTLFEQLHAELEQSFRDELTALAQTDPVAARTKFMDRLAFELTGRSRVLFGRPAIKWPDLGESLRGRRVSERLLEAVPITLLLNVVTIPIIYAVAIITGIYAARHRGTLIDVGSGFTFLFLWSVPTIWSGVMLIGFLANQQHIQLFPTAGLHHLLADSMAFLPSWTDQGFQRGWLLDMCWHLVLPVFCLTYGGFAVLSKLTRGAVLENLQADFVRTARAKGVTERDILFRHVLRNSVLPLITVAAAILPALMTGSVIVENIFSIPGMGKLGVEAAFQKDRELVMGTTLIAAVIGLLSELIRDVCYAVADPRVSYE